MKKNKKESKTRITDKVFRWCPLILVLLIIMFFGIKNTLRNKALSRRGICTKAWVISSYETGLGASVQNIKYEFKINNSAYVGNDVGSEKIGNTITVIYLLDNPTVNRPSKPLHSTYCDCNDQK